MSKNPKATTAAVGMFDGVHLGHQALVDFVGCCARDSEREPVVFSFTRHPLQVVAPASAPPLLTAVDERLELLRLAGASQAIALDFDQALRRLTAKEFMLMLSRVYGVEQLVLGFNHRFGSDRLTDFADYQRIGSSLGIDVRLCTEMVTDPQGRPVSSSAIRQFLTDGDAASASAMLGRPYALQGIVVHGRGLGHTFGFPTANVQPSCPEQLVPAPGVYACLASVGALKSAPAMVNIGTRPTVDGHRLTIEANIIGADADLYGLEATLHFVSRLRSERRFPSVESLAAQLAIDRHDVLNLLNCQ